MIKKFKNKLKQDIHFSELIKGSAGAFVFRLLGMLLGYVFLLIVAREYGAEGSGIFALTLTFISIGALMAKAGIDIGTMKNISKYNPQESPQKIKGHYLQGLGLVLLISLFITIVFNLSSLKISEYILNKPDLGYVFFWSAFIIIVLALIQFHAEALRGLKLVSHYSFLMITSVYLFSTILVLSNIDFGITGLQFIDSFFIAHIVTLVIGVFFWLKNSNFRKNLPRYTEKHSDLIRSSLPIMMTGSVVMVMGWTDIIMLGIYTTEEDVGVYNIALKLAAVTTLSLIAINSIVAPKISRMYSENKLDEMQKFIHQATKLIFVTALPVLIIYIALPGTILGIFGSEFIVGATALIILTFGQFINATSGPVGQILNMTDKQKVLRDTGFLAASINIILNYFLIPQYGIEGAAFSTAFSGILWNLLCVFYIYKKFHILVFYIPGIKHGKNIPINK